MTNLLHNVVHVIQNRQGMGTKLILVDYFPILKEVGSMVLKTIRGAPEGGSVQSRMLGAASTSLVGMCASLRKAGDEVLRQFDDTHLLS